MINIWPFVTEIIPRKVSGRDILAARRAAEQEQNGAGGDHSADEEEDEEEKEADTEVKMETGDDTGELWHLHNYYTKSFQSVYTNQCILLS